MLAKTLDHIGAGWYIPPAFADAEAV